MYEVAEVIEELITQADEGEYVYVYESHMGGVYITTDIQDYDEIYCEVCGDSDMLITQGSREQLLKRYWNEFYKIHTIGRDLIRLLGTEKEIEELLNDYGLQDDGKDCTDIEGTCIDLRDLGRYNFGGVEELINATHIPYICKECILEELYYIMS